MNSVGPYRLYSRAAQISANPAAAAPVIASPATRTVRNEAIRSACTAAANTDSIDGTNEVMVTSCASMVAAR
ncbi:hypothetical protein GCM10027088_22800 [Nocardia goodfellowii]